MIIGFISKKLIPFIQIYGLYVIMHGESGPGGGFQGGVILGSSFILYALAFGLDKGRDFFPVRVGDALIPLGVLIYGGIGLATILIGGMYLEYRVLPFGSPQWASHIGILGIEIGVGITVAGVMATLYFEIARKEE